MRSAAITPPARMAHLVRPTLRRNLTLAPAAAAKALTAATQATNNRLTRCPMSAGDGIAGLRQQIPSLQRNASHAAASSPLVSFTTLPNGVRVATDATPGHFPALGIYIDAGTRFERPWVTGESGVSHLIDRMAFKSTKNRTAEQMSIDSQRVGGNFMCSASRETIIYQASTFSHSVSDLMSILSDTVLNPCLSAEELDGEKEAASWEIAEFRKKPETIITDLLHSVAYNNATLGNSVICTAENLGVMTRDNLRDFRSAWFTPERIVVAGAGLEHQQLIELTEPLFGSLKSATYGGSLGSSTSSSSLSSMNSARSSSSRNSISSLLSSVSSASTAASFAHSADFSTAAKVNAMHSTDLSALPSRADVAEAKAVYTGGELYEARNELEFTHVYVAFEGLSILDDDIYALATLQVLLGGGGSFSAGGPGKGMYSRLYTNVLNSYPAVDFCAAFHHCYADSGLFGIAASVDPSFNQHIPHIIARELELLCTSYGPGSVQRGELQRAKNQLKSSLVMALESRLVQVEDVGRQVQVHGRSISVDEMCEKIDAVDLSTLNRVASRIVRPLDGGSDLNYGLGSGEASIVAMGKLDGLGDVRSLLRGRGLGVQA